MPARTQQDLVNEELLTRPRVTKELLKLPGITTLHTKSKEEIAETLTMVLKSRANIVGMNWVIGQYIELTLD
jgi:hypothetical protein